MLDILADFWGTIKYSIMPDDMDDVAEKLVNTLIENDYDASDIRDAFGGDKAVLEALKNIADIDAEDWDEIEEDFDEDNYYDEE